MRTFNLGESQPSYLEDDLIKRNSSSTNSPTNWWTAVLGQQLRQRASSTPTNTTSSNINNNSHSDNVANFGGFYSSSSFSFKSAARFEDSDDLGFYAAAGGPSWLKPLLHSAAFVWLKARFAPSKLTSNLSFFIQIIAVSLIFLAFVLPAFVFLLKGRSGSKHLNRYYAPRGSSFSYSSNSLSSQENPENDAYFTEPYGAISPESGKALRDAMNGIAQSMASLTNNFIDDIQLELEPAEASNPLDLIRHRYLLYTPDNDIEYQISAFENALGEWWIG